MLNKELLMMGGAEELWTLRFKFTGDSYIHLTLWDSTDQTHILWEGNPSTDIVTVRVPPKSTPLIYTHATVVYNVLNENGCIVEFYDRHELTITLFQSEAYLEVEFIG